MGEKLVHVGRTTAGVLDGSITLDDWDDEELMRGKRRAGDGTFKGRPLKVLPAALHRELTKRRMSRAYDLLADSLVDAAQMLRSIVNDAQASPGDRIKAAELIFDRVLGKPKESLALDVRADDASPLRRMMLQAFVGTENGLQSGAIMAGIVGTTDQAQGIVDAELVEDDAEILDDT